ncbi:hypothetical protein O144_gp05 [Bacillus phage Wip1]|uniref:Uncharacterized protein n=1 Tax=Bacillus phage Wip1 TaxID=663237 RepID=S5XZY9_9VIRU|nr:hypothetical protein O144_gp05 [Bacillus phage Wip1]AGT13364.1 hypothetical protein [Bacillus phage Wip1]
MFKSVSKIYRDSLKQNIKLNDENAELREQNILLKRKLAKSESLLYQLQNDRSVTNGLIKSSRRKTEI